MDSGERGMNPVAMTIINPRKEYWPSRGSNQRPPVLKSATLPTELWGLACTKQQKGKVNFPNYQDYFQTYEIKCIFPSCNQTLFRKNILKTMIHKSPTQYVFMHVLVKRTPGKYG